MNFSDIRETVDRNSTNTLWSYWNNAANLLKTSIYQLSPTTTSPNKQTGGGKELISGSVGPGCGDLGTISDLFKTMSSAKLTKYVTNTRMWISATILQRLVKEFDKIDSEFAIRGFSDIKIGSVGLERLKKTAENHPILLGSLLIWWAILYHPDDLMIDYVPKWLPIAVALSIIVFLAFSEVYKQVDYNCCSMIREAAVSSKDFGPADPIVS